MPNVWLCMTVKMQCGFHSVCWRSKQELVITLTVLLISRMTIQELPWPLNMFIVNMGKSTFDTFTKTTLLWADEYMTEFVKQLTDILRRFHLQVSGRLPKVQTPVWWLCVNKISEKRISLSLVERSFPSSTGHTDGPKGWGHSRMDTDASWLLHREG